MRGQPQRAIILLVVVVGVTLAILATVYYWPVSTWTHTLQRVVSLCTARASEIQHWPISAFFAALTAAPLIGFPVAPLLVATGGRLDFPHAFLMVGASLAINLSLSFLLGRTILRRGLLRLFAYFGYQMPEVTYENQMQLALLLRITPGIPVAVGNYLLPIAGVRFSAYFIISWLVQMAFAAGFLTLGRSLFSGRTGVLILALCVILGATMATRLLRSRLTRHQRATEQHEPRA